MDGLIAEANAVNSLKNATGEPKEVSDPDGLSQVGFEVQVDDQFTPDVSLCCACIEIASIRVKS